MLDWLKAMLLWYASICDKSWELFVGQTLDQSQPIYVNLENKMYILCKLMLIYVNLCRNISPCGSHELHMGSVGMGSMGPGPMGTIRWYIFE